MLNTSDAWANLDARALMLDLDDREIDLAVEQARLRVSPADGLTDADRVALRAHRADLMICVLASDDRTLERLAGMQAGCLAPRVAVAGRCSTCAEGHEDTRRIGPCSWCRLAGMQFVHWQVTQAWATTATVPPALVMQAQAAVLSPRLLGLFPSAISGHAAALFPEVA